MTVRMTFLPYWVLPLRHSETTAIFHSTPHPPVEIDQTPNYSSEAGEGEWRDRTESIAGGVHKEAAPSGLCEDFVGRVQADVEIGRA